MMGQWEVSRQQVAIAGLVINAQTQKAMGEVLIAITDAPTEFVAKLLTRIQLIAIPSAQQAAFQEILDATTNSAKLAAIKRLLMLLPASLVKTILPKRPDQTYTAPDGHFYFLDLPDGKYALTGSLSSLGSRYGTAQAKNITIKRDADGKITTVNPDVIQLPPTTLKGKIVAQSGGNNIVLAEIRIQGSGAATFSNKEGDYMLTELETSSEKRVIEVKAPGFQSAEKQILLNKEGSEKTLDFALKK
jgi:CarboxypepD_reg-like domain